MKHITLAVACMALMAAPALGDWADDFQSYALNSTLSGQGGWAGWDGGLAAAIASNEHPKFAGDQAARLSINDDLVQEYVGYTSGAWVYSAKVFIPSTQQGKENGTFFILMNKYTAASKGWALQLHFDLINNIVRDSEAAEGFVPVVYDAWADIRVEIDLDANFKTTYYNGTKLGVGPWYDPASGDHLKSIAALDLWADKGGEGVCYDDLSITPGTPAPVRTDDLTTYPGCAARYLVNMGRGLGDTTVTGTGMPSGVCEIVNGGGNQNAWWHINDGNPWESNKMVTYYGSGPDYFGYKFKLPATVKQITWWNYVFGDGGTFAATPEVQYLDAAGTWHTITDVTWDRPYKTEYAAVYGSTTYAYGVRRYIVTINNPPKSVWGLRLFGEPLPGGDDDGADIAGTGFLAVTEMTLYGDIELGSLDLSTNLALGATAVANDSQHANLAALTNGLTEEGNFDTTWNAANSLPAHEDYLGVTWAAPQNNVAAMGVVFNGFTDGGYFNPCNNLRVEYTRDGTTWTAVSGLDLGHYTADWPTLRAYSWGPDVAYLFRFDAVSGITGLRVIGDPDGFSGDIDGFVSASELEVFANKTSEAKPVTGQSSAASSKSLLNNEFVNTIQYVWNIVAL